MSDARNGGPDARAADLAATVDLDRAASRARGRLALGLASGNGLGPGADAEVARATLGRAGALRFAPLAVLAGCAGAPLAAIAAAGPALAAERGEGPSLTLAMIGVWAAGAAFAATRAPALAVGAWGRHRVAHLAALLSGLGLALAAIATTLGGFAVAGIGSGIAFAVLPGVAADLFPAEARAASLGAFRATAFMGMAITAGFASITAGWAGSRVVGCIGILVALASIAATRLRDPGAAEPDRARLHALVHPDVAAPAERVRLRAGLRRAFMIPTFRYGTAARVALGVALVALHVHVVRVMGLEWGLGARGRGTAYAAAALAAGAAAALVRARVADGLRTDPARLVSSVVAALAAGGIALMFGGPWPSSGGASFIVAAFALIAAAAVGMDVLTAATLRPEVRAMGNAAAVAVTGAGALLGVLVLNLIEGRSGPGHAVHVAGVALLGGALAFRRARARVTPDIDAAVDAELDVAELQVARARGERPALLACRHLDFSYGPVQVLFDVSFAIDDGEMVALLGTNGAGKSTLLRVISGLGMPSRGSVRFEGTDITYLDPGARVARGITQIPGGRAVFGPMTVAENLRAYAYAVGRDRRAVARGMDEAFEAFPRLAERRNQLAQTLSGGERQMLALSKALILRPRLLLIDELSLGLAPVVVAELLEMVRRINGGGTAVVLVEQSVNVALSLARHAYYMEKGEVRFDGSSAELLDRPDLLRSVYLKGAAEGMGV